MIKLAGMTSQVRFDGAQTSQAAELRIQHRDQMSLCLEAARITVGSVFLHKPIDDVPWNLLQKPVKNDILVLHGVGPFSCPVDSQLTGIEENQCRALHQAQTVPDSRG